MKKTLLTGVLLAKALAPALLLAQESPVLEQPGPADGMMFERLHPEVKQKEKGYPKIELKIGGIENGKWIPQKFAFCAPDGKGHSKDGGNISPSLSWGDLPAGTKSLVLLMVDPDVPTKFDDANKDGKAIPAAMPRQDFYHWVVVDIPPALKGVFEGADSKGITPGGKKSGRHAYGFTGRNDYAKFYKGEYGGYDGPCPPWNDERLHHYHFELYALDMPTIGLPYPIAAPLVVQTMQGHILGKGEVVGIYSNNKTWLEQKKHDLQRSKELVPGERFDPKDGKIYR